MSVLTVGVVLKRLQEYNDKAHYMEDGVQKMKGENNNA
jgi:hypothetical protein